MRRTPLNIPHASTGATITVHAITARTTEAFKHTGTTLGVRMYNKNGDTFGNDGGFDNLRVEDVTPHLSKAFATAFASAGGIAQIVFTITNTTDNLAKPGWEFTDNLAAGLTLANTTIGGTCRNFANTAALAQIVGSVGGSSFTIRGSLPAGVSCTVTVNVRVAAGTTSPALQNCGSNIASPIFVIPPANSTCATLVVTRPITLAKTWGGGAIAGNAVGMTINGAAIDVYAANTGSSTAPGPGSPASAQARLGSQITLMENFTNGAAANYSSTLECRKISDGALVASTGSGLSRAITMPLDSGVACAFTNARETDVSIQKTRPPGVLSVGSQAVFTLVVTNHGPLAANGTVVSDPAVAGLDCTGAGLPAPTCSASAGATCPSPLTAAGIQAGVAIPALPNAGVVTLGVTCKVTASGF